MDSALLSAIVKQLGRFISSEFALTARVKGEVRKLKIKFRTIQAVLNDAEKRQLKEEAVKLWLDKLKSVSYEVDDVLDEWNTATIREEIEKQQKEDENAETSTAKKKKVSPLITVPNLFQHRYIAHKIKELNEKLDEINKEREVFGFELSRAIKEVDERPKTTSYVDVSDIHILGRDKVKNDLVSILLGKGTEKEKHPHVISLVGMGGIGKTTLAQLAFNHHEVMDHFEERIWVCVSEPFDQCRVAKAIVEALGVRDFDTTELQSLLGKICELIGGKKFFLVFDDVWTEDYAMWKPFIDALKNCGSQISRILVTTRKEKVAKMMESANMIKLEELSEEDCWLVFSKIAFLDEDPKQCEQLQDVGRKISKKCKGLPLAAKTLGSLMHFKKSREEWEMVLCSSMWELEDVERGLFAPLLLSYHDLSSPLKQCFSYCGVFPKNYVFSSDELVFMWMAQGYIKPKANMEIEIIAREYFENLAIRSFFQDFKKVEDDDKIIRCKMHDIVHDFAQLMSKNECIGSSGVELGLYYKNIHHLQVEIPKYSHFPEGVYDAKNLRTLILVCQNDHILYNLFRHFRCLRILTLTCQDDNMFKELPDAVGNFIHLRYLNLVNYCGYVLPETICNLCNLQILKISFGIARVKKLPQGMGKLINLRHLTLDCLYFGLDLEFPRGFGRLVSLRTLSHFNISGKDDSEGCKLGELKNLNHLQGALQIRRLGSVLDACEAEDAQLKKKICLRTLFLRFDRSDCEDCEDIQNNDGLILNGLEPPPCLEYLCIEEYRATTMSTNWMMSLTNLKKLDIRYAFLEHLPPLGKLLFLESLHIDKAIYLKRVGVEFLGIESKKKKDNIIVFPSLKYLTFESLYEWKEWIGIGREEEEEDCITIMPRLEKLTFRSCEMLLSLPDFLRKSPTKQLVIHNCCYLSKCCEEEDWPKISHIPNIIIDYKYVQGGREYMPEPVVTSSEASSFILQYINIKLIKNLFFCQNFPLKN